MQTNKTTKGVSVKIEFVLLARLDISINYPVGKIFHSVCGGRENL